MGMQVPAPIWIPRSKKTLGGFSPNPPDISADPSFNYYTRRKTGSAKPSGNPVSRQFPGPPGGFQAYPPWPRAGGFKRFKIQKVGGLAGNPLSPDLSNGPFPGRIFS
jgi:hypothetical protein